MQLNIFLSFIVISLVTVIIVGIFVVGFMNHTGHNTCPISVLSGNDCLSINGVIALTSHHLSGLQNLTQYIPSSGMNLLLSVSLLLAAFSFVFINQNPQKKLSGFKITFLFNKNDTKSHRQILRWMALLHRQGYSLAIHGCRI